jgi:hypothetical protein
MILVSCFDGAGKKAKPAELILEVNFRMLVLQQNPIFRLEAVMISVIRLIYFLIRSRI